MLVVLGAVIAPPAIFHTFVDVDGVFAAFLLTIAAGFTAIVWAFSPRPWNCFLIGLLYFTSMLSAAVFMGIGAGYG
jgi:hypothetical protein